MRNVLRELPSEGEWCSLSLYRFKLGICAGSEATHQKSQGKHRLAITYIMPIDFCSRGGFQEDIRVELVEFTSLNQIKIWPHRGRDQDRNSVWLCGKTAHALKSDNSVSLCVVSLPAEWNLL